LRDSKAFEQLKEPEELKIKSTINSDAVAEREE